MPWREFVTKEGRNALLEFLRNMTPQVVLLTGGLLNLKGTTPLESVTLRIVASSICFVLVFMAGMFSASALIESIANRHLERIHPQVYRLEMPDGTHRWDVKRWLLEQGFGYAALLAILLLVVEVAVLATFTTAMKQAGN